MTLPCNSKTRIVKDCGADKPHPNFLHALFECNCIPPCAMESLGCAYNQLQYSLGLARNDRAILYLRPSHIPGLQKCPAHVLSAPVDSFIASIEMWPLQAGPVASLMCAIRSTRMMPKQLYYHPKEYSALATTHFVLMPCPATRPHRDALGPMTPTLGFRVGVPVPPASAAQRCCASMVRSYLRANNHQSELLQGTTMQPEHRSKRTRLATHQSVSLPSAWQQMEVRTQWKPPIRYAYSGGMPPARLLQ